MSLTTSELNKYFIRCLGDSLVDSSDVNEKPLCVKVKMPEEKKLRVYLYNSGNPPGGRPLGEYKIVLNVGQPYGCRGNFDYSDGYIVLLIGYIEAHDVFVFWDATRHKDFAFNKNLQVKATTVLTALANELSYQNRKTDNGTEIVIAARAENLKLAIRKRIDLMVEQMIEG